MVGLVGHGLLLFMNLVVHSRTANLARPNKILFVLALRFGSPPLQPSTKAPKFLRINLQKRCYTNKFFRKLNNRNPFSKGVGAEIRVRALGWRWQDRVNAPAGETT